MRISIDSEELDLLPLRALFWPARRTLFVADLHLGKAATFAAAGVPVPAETTDADLDRLTRCIDSTAAARLVVLGDLFHARHAKEPHTLDRFLRWRRHHRSLAITLVRGNHDRSAGATPPELEISSVEEPHRDPPFIFAHEPCEDPLGHVLAGHVHPGFTIRDGSGGAARLPCFVVGDRRTILPSFGTFTGLGRFTAAAGDRVYLVGEEIIPVR